MHRNSQKISEIKKGGQSQELIFHFYKGKGIWASREYKLWGSNQEIHRGTNEVKGLGDLFMQTPLLAASLSPVMSLFLIWETGTPSQREIYAMFLGRSGKGREYFCCQSADSCVIILCGKIHSACMHSNLSTLRSLVSFFFSI